MTEFELFQALRPHYPAREYALLPQVANGTGARANRHADALALSLWPSRGLRLHGFEIKSYRGDWTRELANPEKAEEIAKFCHHWWIVTAYPMVKGDELPPGWGLMEYDNEKAVLKKVVSAPFREAVPADLPFIAAMLRKAQDVVTPDALLATAKEESFAAGKKAGEDLSNWQAKEYQILKSRVADFEKASGVQITGWKDAESIGSAVRAVLEGSVTRHTENLRRLATRILEELSGGRSDRRG